MPLEPDGAPLEDGYAIMYEFANYPNVGLWEKSGTPPTRDMGDGIDQTTMHNEEYETALPGALKKVGDGSFKAAYATAVEDDLNEMLGDNQLITLHYPNGATYAFWGWLAKFAPDELVRNTQPTAECVVKASNLNNASPRERVDPVYTPPA